MGYEPYPRQNRDEIWGSHEGDDPGYGYRPDHDRGRSSAREYAAAGAYDRDHDARFDEGRYGSRERGGPGRATAPRGNDAGDTRRPNDNRGHDRRPEGYAYQDRDFLSRAGDEVRSWFGDEDAERRRAFDARHDDRTESGPANRDGDYHGWRKRQIADLDRDYDEYRRENATRFENEFGSWRTERQTQRTSLQRVAEHMEVIGSDGQHVGTVDKVRGDRIILTRTDQDAGGHHHSIPSRWVETVDDKVTIRKTADEAKAAWRDEDRSGALFGEQGDRSGAPYLNRSFSGTY